VSFFVLSPQTNRCCPSSQISPKCETAGFFSSLSTSKSSSFILSLRESLKRSSNSPGSKPVKDTSKSEAFKSVMRSANLSLSQSPLILFSAMFSAFSFCSSISTTTHSISSMPILSRIFKRWWPPMTLPVVLFHITCSTYPNSSRERLSFSYSGSPGFKSFLGLYSAGMSCLVFIFSINILFHRLSKFTVLIYILPRE